MEAGPSGGRIDVLLAQIASWATKRSDIRAVALVGSYARNTARKDSDVDLVLLTSRPTDYTMREDWVSELGIGELVQTKDWGAITERRLQRPDGLEVEVGIGEPTWASVNPVDPGTRRVVTDGMRLLHDPDRLLQLLLQACS